MLNLFSELSKSFWIKKCKQLFMMLILIKIVKFQELSVYVDKKKQ
jgi:hypothetical protein